MQNLEFEFFQQPEKGDARPFSRVVRAGNMVYVSGHSAPHDPEREIFRGDTPADEVRNSLNYMAMLLMDTGSSLERVVRIRPV